MQSIIIRKHHKTLLKKHSEKYKPNESCAILFGSTNEKTMLVKDIFLTDNIQESRVNFTISNEELLKAYKESQEKGLEVIGIFHSHPSSEAYPSSTDQKFMKINPVAWMILSGIDGELRGFILDSNDKMEEIKIIEEE